MMIDASAIVAILNGEPDAAALAGAIGAASRPLSSPVALFEASVALMRENRWTADEADAVLREFLRSAAIEVISINEGTARAAVRVFEKYGKGRHPARLNLGDCFAYACARASQSPLLYKGDDFARTDVNTQSS